MKTVIIIIIIKRNKILEMMTVVTVKSNKENINQ